MTIAPWLFWLMLAGDVLGLLSLLLIGWAILDAVAYAKRRMPLGG